MLPRDREGPYAVPRARLEDPAFDEPIRLPRVPGRVRHVPFRGTRSCSGAGKRIEASTVYLLRRIRRRRSRSGARPAPAGRRALAGGGFRRQDSPRLGGGGLPRDVLLSQDIPLREPERRTIRPFEIRRGQTDRAAESGGDGGGGWRHRAG